MPARPRRTARLESLEGDVTSAIDCETSALLDRSLPIRQRFEAACALIEVGRELQGQAADIRSRILREMLDEPGMTMAKAADTLGLSLPAVAKIAHRGRYDKQGRKLPAVQRGVAPVSGKPTRRGDGSSPV